MKLVPLLPLFLLVILCLFSLQAQAQAQGGGNLCPKELTLDGTCGGISGGINCAAEFLAQFGASAMPQHCTCSDINQKRLCKCDIVCR